LDGCVVVPYGFIVVAATRRKRARAKNKKALAIGGMILIWAPFLSQMSQL
jgi:hypothetical protein